MAWTLVYSRRATRDLDALPDSDRRAMHARLAQLMTDPGSVDLTKLGGSLWRLRSRRWRAILEMDTHSGVTTVLRVRPRNEGTHRD